ncbi:hypothetical protein E8E11_002966 [Didymella keratinophila]|nr:hypothetical protein E8E11_002966 [Didymella keratinophila]
MSAYTANYIPQYGMTPTQQYGMPPMQQYPMAPMQQYPMAPMQNYQMTPNYWPPMPVYSQPISQRVMLLTIPISTFKAVGVKKPIDVVAHWTICVNGICYELARQNDKKNPYRYKWTPEHEFRARRAGQGKQIEEAYLGDMAMPYPHHIIDEVATLVWERSLKKKYAYDEYNCQVFVRLLLELIGDQNTKAAFPAFLDKWIKAAGNSRDGGFFTFAAGASMMAAGLAFMGTDGGATSAAGFALAAQTTLRSTAWLLTERDNRGKKIKEGQKEIRKEMQSRGRPLAEPENKKK